MKQKRYRVIDADTAEILADDMNLNMALCFIQGYVITYSNQPLSLYINEILEERDDHS